MPSASGRRIRALIFDFDGLILDTELPEFLSWQETFAAHGVTLTLAAWSQNIGTSDHGWDPYDQLQLASGVPIDRAAVRTRRRARFAELVEGERALPGVEAYVRAAKSRGLLLGVASSSTRAWVEEHLERTGLAGEFDVIRCSDDVRRTKPDPELYQDVVAALGVAAEDAIALEDSPNGVAAAKRAGLFCVAVPNRLTAELDLTAADLRLGSLAELPLADLLAGIEAQEPNSRRAASSA